MKKSIVSCVLFQLVFILFLCVSFLNAQNINPISRVIKNSSHNYIEFNGMPFLMYGIQLRIDDYLGSWPYSNASKLSTVYQYFEKTNSAGFKNAVIVIPWFWIETGDNQFNFSLVDTFLANANKYNLRLQLIWAGSNVSGWNYLPSYISNDHIQYPTISITANAPPVFSNPNLIAKETRAMKNFINYLAKNDTAKRVMMIQVENEPDHKGATSTLWAGGQKSDALHMIDTLGQIIHASPANMITRTNLTGWATPADTLDFLSMKGVDVFGRDLYVDKVNPDFFNGSGMLDCSWNCNYTPENGAQYANSINLALAAFDKGTGYIMYELRTTGWRTGSYDLGLYRASSANDWVERNGTMNVAYSLSNTDSRQEVDLSEVKAFNTLIYKVDKKLAICPNQKSAGFNLDNLQGSVNETQSFSNYTINYSSPNGGEAMAFEDENGTITLLSLKDNSTFAFNKLPSNLYASIGYYDDLNKWHENSSRQITSQSVTLNANESAILIPVVVTAPIPVGNNGPAESDFIIYPNPNNGQFKLKLVKPFTFPIQVEIFSQNLEKVYVDMLYDNPLTISMNNLSHGSYIIKLYDIHKKESFVEKFIVN